MAQDAPTETPAPDVPGYRIERMLGRGGFGSVFSATDARGQRVALKVATPGDETASGQLAREERALRAVGPAVAPAVHGSGKLPDGTAYLALDLLEPPTLAERLREVAGPLELARGGVRLIDFGLARTFKERQERTAFAGTAEYASPEQCEERSDLDPRADLYAIGVLVFE